MATVAALAGAPPAAAQALARTVHIVADNDYFTFWRAPHRRADDNYTQGARVTWDAAGTPGIVRRLVCPHGRSCGTAFEFGQEMYTPTLDAPMPIPGERPYAGWLYGRATVVGGTARTRRSLGVTLGVTGRPSLAAQTQEAFHRLVPGFRRPLGWAHQLATEPAFALRAEQTWRIAPPGPGGRVADVVTTADAAIGTLRTAAGAQGRARLGAGLAHPWLAPAAPGRWSVYLFAGARGEAIARDLFLDGSTFRSSPRVTRAMLVSEWERGVGARIARLTTEYRAVSRGREYRTGPREHTYGAMTLSWAIR